MRKLKILFMSKSILNPPKKSNFIPNCRQKSVFICPNLQSEKFAKMLVNYQSQSNMILGRRLKLAQTKQSQKQIRKPDFLVMGGNGPAKWRGRSSRKYMTI